MKILIVSAHDLHGGAGRAAFRLHQSLRMIGVDSLMLVQHRLGSDQNVAGASGFRGRVVNAIRVRLDRLPLLMYPSHSELWFSPAWLPGRTVVDKINGSDADIVHLHWVTGGMMRVEHIAEIEKPLVWTLHDMWPMTGGCHYDDGCGRFKRSCGVCPQLGSKSSKDLSSWVFQRKRLSLKGRNQLHLVASSKWMADLISSSPILRNRDVSILPNPVDCDVFRPTDRLRARKRFKIATDEKVVLFGAVNPSDPIKGFDLLREALDRLSSPGNVSVAVFGRMDDSVAKELPVPTRFVGSISDERKLSELYSAADVFVVPSIQDNLPLVATESLACGTPVVAFGATGLPDIVDHGETGYLARPYEPDDLANGISWVLSHESREEMRWHARKSALSRFESTSVAEKYRGLYTELLADR
jgi:glycosyltransferase involved in cell wall biosynthesis